MNRNLRPDTMGIIFLLCLVVGTLWTWQDSVIGTHFLEFIMWSLTLGAMIFALLSLFYATLNGLSEALNTPN